MMTWPDPVTIFSRPWHRVLKTYIVSSPEYIGLLTTGWLFTVLKTHKLFIDIFPILEKYTESSLVTEQHSFLQISWQPSGNTFKHFICNWHSLSWCVYVSIYSSLMTQWVFTRGVNDQSRAFLDGFSEVVPLQWLQYFDERELEVRLTFSFYCRVLCYIVMV